MAKAIEVANLSKRYGATVALNDVSFSIDVGEVRALIGENGAGKSTIVKILSGLVTPDRGTITVLGRSSSGFHPRAAHAIGIQTAFQELTLVRDLTIAQNFLIPYEPQFAGQVSVSVSDRMVRNFLTEFGLGFVKPDAFPYDYNLATRQKIEIAKAVSRAPNVLLLDEPTSALGVDDVDWLAALVERLSQRGVTVVFVSHRMEEVRRFCSSITLLRNGDHVGTFQIDAISDTEIVEHIVGRSIGAIFPTKPSRAMTKGPPVLAARHVSTGAKIKEVSFELASGEVLGIAALQGMGQLDLFHALFGETEIASGHLELDGVSLKLSSPRDAVRAGIDLGLVPEDRGTEGLALDRPARETASMPILERISRLGHILRKKEDSIVDEAFARLRVPPRAAYMPGRSFSGGNQQKIVIAKWLVANSRVLLMFDPTRGIDIGAKHEIYKIIRDLAAEGRSVILYSTETTELAKLCDRVLVLYEGRIVRKLEGEEITENRIVTAMMGALFAEKVTA